MRVIIADDHPAVREGVRKLLDGRRVIDVVGEFSAPDDLLEHLPEKKCDLLITDLSMPGRGQPDGLPMIEAIRRLQPGLRIVILTMIFSEHSLRELWRSGVSALVDKAAHLASLHEALDAVTQGRSYVSASFDRLMRFAGRRRDLAVDSRPEVIGMLAEGMAVPQISERLSQSEQTTRMQLESAVDAYGFLSTAELARYLAENP